MITLEEYKKYLINFYRYEEDNNNTKKEERTQTLAGKYSDEYLERIISDTYDFIYRLIDDKIAYNQYFFLALEKDTSKYISLNNSGGGHADTIYVTPDNKIISRYIMKKEFGQNFYFEMEEAENTHNIDGDDVFTPDLYYYLEMRNFPDNIDEIKERLFGKTLSIGNGSQC